jgi:drug/metabolite transporter (DMT)-like permease
LERAGATNLLLVTFLVPISAIFFGITILDEAITWSQMIGALVIMSGLVMVDGRVLPNLKQNK